MESSRRRGARELSPVFYQWDSQYFPNSTLWAGTVFPFLVRTARASAGTSICRYSPQFRPLDYWAYYVEMGLQEKRHTEEERRELNRRTEVQCQRRELREHKHMMRCTTFGTVDPQKGKASTSHIYIDSDEEEDPVEFLGGHSRYLWDDRHNPTP